MTRSKELPAPTPAERKRIERQEDHELERLAYLESLDPRQRSGPWSLDPA